MSKRTGLGKGLGAFFGDDYDISQTKPRAPEAVNEEIRTSGGGATLFLAGAGHGYCEKKQKWTRRYLLDTAVSLKKGDFNTPSVFSFFKKKTAA